MRFCLVSSNSDIASTNIREALLSSFDFRNIDGILTLNLEEHSIFMECIEGSLLEFNNPEKSIDADVFVFLCSHTSSKGVPALTVHAPGNFGVAELGGFEGKVSNVHSVLMKLCLMELRSNCDKMKLDFDVCYEATHHGPLVSKPCMFVELGSDETKWKNKDGALCIAISLISSIKKINVFKNFIPALCLGGNHYCKNFTKIGLHSDYAPSHICCKRELEFLNESLLVDVLENCFPKCDTVILDWKGLGAFKNNFLPILEKLDLKILKASEIDKQLTKIF